MHGARALEGRTSGSHKGILALIISSLGCVFVCVNSQYSWPSTAGGHVWLVSYPRVINLALLVITMFLSVVCFH